MFTPEYIVGLVDGEGSFTVYIRDPNSSDARIRRVKAEPKFYLKLVEKDKEILEELKRYFGCGNVYFQKDSRQHHQQCYRYEVAKRNDLERVIIPFFRRYPPRFPSKNKDFKIFCDFVEMMGRGNHLTQPGLMRMYALKQEMH